MGQVLAKTESVQLVANILPGADAFGQVPDADLVGQGKEGASDLLIGSEAVGLVVGQDVPDGNEQLAGDGYLCFLRNRPAAQVPMLDAQLSADRRRVCSTTPTPTIWATLRLWSRVAALWRVHWRGLIRLGTTALRQAQR